MKLTAIILSTLFAAAAIAHAGHDHTATPSAPSDNYPLTTCVVSGDKLGEMGAPVQYVYKQSGKPDRVVQLCCKDCIKDFEKDPAKYLAKLDAAVAAKSSEPATGNTESCCELLEHYLPISEALAADDFAKAKSAAADLVKEADDDGMTGVAKAARALIGAGNIEGARLAFKSLSDEIEPLADGTKGTVVMYCPMAKADWVQTGTNVRNPYYGKAMLTCGAPKAPNAK